MAFATAARPRRGEPSGRSGSIAVSTRETKKLATEWTSAIGWCAARRRSRPRMYAMWIASYWASEKSSVTLTLIPAAIVSSIAGTPSAVPGILM